MGNVIQFRKAKDYIYKDVVLSDVCLADLIKLTTNQEDTVEVALTIKHPDGRFTVVTDMERSDLLDHLEDVLDSSEI